jgi:ABC-2 type transport system permease protein
VPATGLFLVILVLVQPVSIGGMIALVGVVLLTWLMATTLGFFISTLFNQLREIWPLGTLVFSTLSVLPPLFYPISKIPSAWQWVAFLAPSTFAGQLADDVVGLGTSTGSALFDSPYFDLAGLAVATLIFGLAAMFLARWREP